MLICMVAIRHLARHLKIKNWVQTLTTSFSFNKSHIFDASSTNIYCKYVIYKYKKQYVEHTFWKLGDERPYLNILTVREKMENCTDILVNSI